MIKSYAEFVLSDLQLRILNECLNFIKQEYNRYDSKTGIDITQIVNFSHDTKNELFFECLLKQLKTIGFKATIIYEEKIKIKLYKTKFIYDKYENGEKIYYLEKY